MILTSQYRLGDPLAALRAIDAIKVIEARDEALVRLALDRASAGDLPSALKLVERLESPARRDRALIDVAAALPAREEP